MEQYVTEMQKFQTFLLHFLVSCISICLLVEYGVILSIIHRDNWDINNRRKISVNNGQNDPYCSKGIKKNIPYKLSYIRLITYYGVTYQ